MVCMFVGSWISINRIYTVENEGFLVGYVAEEICIPECCVCMCVCEKTNVCCTSAPVLCEDRPPAGHGRTDLLLDPAYIQAW